MTREELKEHCEKQIEMCEMWATAKGEEPSGKIYEEHKLILELLKQESCEDVAKERYEDLCEYFGGAKDILKHREDFKAWLGRVKWHIHKAEELAAENDDLRDQLAMRDRFQKQEPCEDEYIKVPKKALKYRTAGMVAYNAEWLKNQQLPSVNPTKSGHWIEEIDDYGKILDWHCDKCYEDSGFITDCKWDFCPNCGARMIESEE